MKLRYYTDTDTLSIRLKEGYSVETSEISNDVTIDFDVDSDIISIDIEYASQKLDLNAVEIVNLPKIMSKVAS